MRKLFTIGVFGKTEEEFFGALLTNGITLLVDVRRRRGVRGSTYSFVNKTRLMARLEEQGIGYEHWLELAPTNVIRMVQRQADKTKGTQKRKRAAMSPDFKSAYMEYIDTGTVLELFEKSVVRDEQTVALFCVEEYPEACHRSAAAEYLAGGREDFEIIHL